MRKYAVVVMFLIFFAACQAQEGDEKKCPEVQLTVTGPAAPLTDRSTINLTVTITNNSKGSVELEQLRDDPSPLYAFTIRREDEGERAERRSEDGTVTLISAYFTDLASGASLAEEINLGALYEFKEPGTYKVRLERIGPYSEHPAILKSNEIEVTIAGS